MDAPCFTAPAGLQRSGSARGSDRSVGWPACASSDGCVHRGHPEPLATRNGARSAQPVRLLSRRRSTMLTSDGLEDPEYVERADCPLTGIPPGDPRCVEVLTYGTKAVGLVAPPIGGVLRTRVQQIALEELPPTSAALNVLAAASLAIVLTVAAVGRPQRAYARHLAVLRALSVLRLPSAGHNQIAEAVTAVRRTGRRLPFRVACLEEATSTAVVLALCGRIVTWCHGIAPDPIRLHAWAADRLATLSPSRRAPGFTPRCSTFPTTDGARRRSGSGPTPSPPTTSKLMTSVWVWDRCDATWSSCTSPGRTIPS
jgi:hypothetical protein